MRSARGYLAAAIMLSSLLASGCLPERDNEFDPKSPNYSSDGSVQLDKGGTQKPTCTDSKKNGNETDVDCGGDTCPKCATGKGCSKSDDCVSLFCDTGASKPVCKAASCSDKVKNGDETDVDCGGSCSTKCANSKVCKKDADCQSGKCDTTVTPAICKAIPASCNDNKKNGSETDVDCGGKDCAACADGKACQVKTDCTSGVCTSYKCAAASCTDGVKNGDETDVDCGGSCTTKCKAAKSCLKNGDCESGICDSKVCKAAACNDKIMNGTETDVDCGGLCSTKCGDWKKCKVANDCTSGVCNAAAKTCAPPTCTDAVRNGTETDTDCGGGTCPSCAIGKTCNFGTDCSSGYCDKTNKCGIPPATCTDSKQNGTETDVDCGGGTCPKCINGKKCIVSADCVSANCDSITKTCATKCVPACKPGVCGDPDGCSGTCKAGSGCYSPPGTWKTIQKGTFQMGSPTSEKCRNTTTETQHQVMLNNNFVIQTTEVTQGQFEAVMGYDPSYFSYCGKKCPVEQVNWHESAAYCNALSAKAGLTACYTCSNSGTKNAICQETTAAQGKGIYSCKGFRLPTEAEWEYAYRAGSTTAFYNNLGITKCYAADVNADKIGWYLSNSKVNYSGCDDLSSYGGDKCSGPHPVGQKAGNAWGLEDMAGNVFEWCHDPGVGNYGSGPETNPVGTGPNRVLRGGSWSSRPDFMRAADRDSSTPTIGFNIVGFRCTRTK